MSGAQDYTENARYWQRTRVEACGAGCPPYRKHAAQRSSPKVDRGPTALNSRIVGESLVGFCLPR